MKIKNVILAGICFLALLWGACKKDNNSGPVTPKIVSISTVRAQYKGATVPIAAGTLVTGVVISDTAGRNIGDTSIVIQQASGAAGIQINFASAHSYALGDSIQVDLSGQILENVNGLLQVSNVPLANAQKLGKGSITPLITTAAAISSNLNAWSSTLVTIGKGVLTSTSGNYGGIMTYTDSLNGTIQSVVLTGAAFAGQSLVNTPDSTATITGIVSVNGTSAQINIRNTNDVVEALPTITSTITENFQEIAPLKPGYPYGYAGLLTLTSGRWFVYDADYPKTSTLDAFSSRTNIFLLPQTEQTRVAQVGFQSQPTSYVMSWAAFTNLREVTITFAGDLDTGFNSSYAPDTTVSSYNTHYSLSFNPATDTLGVGLAISADGSTFTPIGKAMISDRGIFHTVTFIIDQKALKTAGIPTGTPLYLQIYNVSVGTSGGTGINLIPVQGSGTPPYTYGMRPIIIDNLVLGF